MLETTELGPHETSTEVEVSIDNAQFIQECQIKTKKYIKSHYGNAIKNSSDLCDDMEQRILELLLRYDIPRYDKSRGDVWMYIMSCISNNAKKAYQEHTSTMGESPEVRRLAKRAMDLMAAKNFNEEEVAKELKIKVSTLRSYINICKTMYSLDAEDDDGNTLYDYVGRGDSKIYDNSINIDKLLNGKTKKEQFILKVYLKQKSEHKRDWKRSTVEICKKKGVTEKQVTEVIKSINK